MGSFFNPPLLVEGLKQQESFPLLALHEDALAFKKWSLTRGSKFNDLTWKILVFQRTGCRGEVVANENLIAVKDNSLLADDFLFFSPV